MGSGTTSFSTGIDLGPFFTQSLIEAFTPKAIRKQQQEQIALEKLAQLESRIAKLPEDEKNAYRNLLFRSYGVYHPPWIRQAFGAGEEAVLPLPEGAAEIKRPMVGPFGIGKKDVRGVYVPETGPFKFSEPVDAAEMRALTKAQKEAQIEATTTLIEERKRPRPWAPLTKEEYQEIHTPPVRPWAPGSKEEYKEVHPSTPRGWQPRSKEEYKEVHPRTEKAPPSLSSADIKPLREALLRMYLAADVWLTEDARTKATLSARAGMWDDVYYQLNIDQRKTFDQIIGMAQPNVKQLGVVESLGQALRNLQQQRPSAFQPSGGGRIRPPGMETQPQPRALPEGVPPGSKLVGKTKDGSPVYLTPEGKNVAVTP